MIVRLRKRSFCSLLFLLGVYAFMQEGYGQEKLAIPGAIGFAKHVRGAYSGSDTPTILYVDRLTDNMGNNGSNKGSFRWCVTRNYPRIILFEVSGYINLENYIRVYNPYVSIYGQTAPGKGVTITGSYVDLRTDYVLIQHLRFRLNSSSTAQEDALTIFMGSNVFVDHCSFSYALDENIGVGGSTGTFKGPLTISNCMLSHPLHGKNSKGILMGGTMDSLSIMRNAFVHCGQRAPFLGDYTYKTAEVVNNLCYNSEYFGIMFDKGDSPKINVIGNEWRKGNNSVSPARRGAVRIRSLMSSGSRFYMKDNLCPGRTGNSEWDGIVRIDVSGADSSDFYSATPFNYTSSSDIYPASELNDNLSSTAGAFYWNRDAVDIEAIDDMINGTGTWIDDSEKYYPEIPALTKSLSVPDNPHQDLDGNGFTNLEEWVYGLAGGSDPCIGFDLSGETTGENQGMSNGAVRITVSGGTSPYSYAWGDGVTSQNRTGLEAGTYSVTATDAEGCKTSESFQVETILPECDLVVTGSITNENQGLSNGAVNITVSGGISPYTYAWNDGPTTQNRTGLTAGTYSVTATDVQGCEASESFQVNTILPECDLVVTGSITDEDQGLSNGAINIIVSGGTSPYTYAWGDGTTTQNRTGLTAGTYLVIATDVQGCEASGSFQVSEIPTSGEKVDNEKPEITVSYESSSGGATEQVIDASQTTDPEGDELTYTWTVPEGLSVKSLNTATLNYLVPDVETDEIAEFQLQVFDGQNTAQQTFRVTFTPYKPEYEEVSVVDVESGGYRGSYYPENVIDKNESTRWSMWGEGEWIALNFENPVRISHIKMSFFNRDKNQALFDFYVSNDGEEWESFSLGQKSCGYSSKAHVYDFSGLKSESEYSYVKIIGNGNTYNKWNSITEIEVYGEAVVAVEEKIDIVASYESSVDGATEQVIDASQTTDPEGDELTYTWTAPEGVSVKSLNTAILDYLVPDVEANELAEFRLEVTDGQDTIQETFQVTFSPYKPEYEEIRVVSIETSGYRDVHYPENVIDNNESTRWSNWGEGEWIALALEESVSINFIKLSFFNRDKNRALFDFYVSEDGLEWEPLLMDQKSCGYSSKTHVYETPNVKSERNYSHVMFMGNGNTYNKWNSITEMKIYGDFIKTTGSSEITPDDILEVFPNPATKFISFTNDVQGGELFIYDMRGKLQFSKSDLSANEQVALDLPLGNYIVKVKAGNQILSQKLMVK
jgi:hypothetical protein